MWMTEPAERSPACLSRLHCDQLLNGELEDRADLKAHQAGCARCTALLARHREERAGFAVPLRRPRRRRRWITPLAAAAAVLGVWLVASRDRRAAPEARSKGRPGLAFYVKHGDAVRPGGPGERVAPGDAINFAASTERPSFLAIVSVDGARHVSVYYPEGPAAAPLPAGRDQVLTLSVVLDDVLGLERLVGVFCDRPIAVAPLEAAVASGAELPEGCVADAVMIEKRRAP
jgi:hypothetical protein